MTKWRTSRFQLLFISAFAFAFAFAGAAAAQTRSAPEIRSDLPLVRVLAVSKGMHFSKGGVSVQSPAETMACPNGPVVSPISCGGAVNGSLEMSDCVFPDNTYYDLWGFSGTAGQQVTIGLSAAFDTWVLLYGASGGAPIADNDDDPAGGTTNSRLVFTLPATGDYFIAANSFDENVFGAYTLTLACTGGGGGACTSNATTLCLNNGRFRVTVTFLTSQGQSGNGMAVPETSDTGMFWFFTANNIEAIIKVVNACSFTAAPRYWVFAGGLTNVQVVVTVTDTLNGTTRTYTNPQGTAFAPIQDTNAFATCP